MTSYCVGSMFLLNALSGDHTKNAGKIYRHIMSKYLQFKK